MFGNLIDDIRYSLRGLIAKPMFLLVTVLTLALGIGANTTIFSVMHGLFLRPLPYPQDEQLVDVYNTYPKMGLEHAGTSIPDYLDRKTQAPSLQDLALHTWESYNLADDGGQPERMSGLKATPSLFSVLGVQPLLGRAFGEAEAVPGQDKVVVLGYSLWKNRFNADPGIVGRDLRLNGEPYRVLGVLPEGISFPSRNIQFWVPFAFTPEQMGFTERGNEYSSSVGRLKAGATIEALNAEMDLIVQRNVEFISAAGIGFDAAGHVSRTGFTGRARSLREQQVGEARAMVTILQAAVAMVLLIACANVANLMLTRVNVRQKELSVRSALGATRGRIARQLVVEAVLLALIGGAVGLGLAYLSIDLMPSVGIHPNSGDYDFQLDGQVLLFALGVTLVAGLLSALLPVLALARMDINEVIKESGRLGGGGRRAAFSRNALVVAQLALATTLLCSAGLLMRSFGEIAGESPGFDSNGLATAFISLPTNRYPDAESRTAFFDQALAKLRTIPGVSHAAFVSNLPFSGSNSSGSYLIPGYTAPEGESAPHAMQRFVDEQYFEAMRIPLIKGRGIEASDRMGTQRVVVIDSLLADKYFKGEDPIGKQILRGNSEVDGVATVVGVVAPIKHENLDKAVTKETIYWPVRQQTDGVGTSFGAFVLRTPAAPGVLMKSMREAILSIDPEQAVHDIKTLDERLSTSLNRYRAPMLLLGFFAGVAMLLAAVGIYGVLAFAVSQRTGELGVRMAIGAAASAILQLILRQGVRLTAIGLAIGLVGAFLMARALSSQLFGVAPTDPLIYGSVVVFLGAIALLACYLPARRAARIDPLVALRYE